MQHRPVKGMNDILPDEIGRWHRVEQAFASWMSLYGYHEVRTPILEATELFIRSIGETTEVVEKQMFILERSGESLALRPEGTASAARAYLNSSRYAREPISRWYYLGQMFRAEQPQRGRYRQFHQAGAEIYGDAGPTCDAELIDMMYGFLAELGVTDVKILLNSLGSGDTRARYRDALATFLKPKAAQLSEHAQKRLQDNALRILDSKDPRDREAIVGAPSILEVMDDADRAHWQGLCNALDALGTPYEVTPSLVRGLDYYTRTLFEFQSSAGQLGTQNALLGGGRYDGMLADLGGPKIPAIGFAMGLERLLLAMPEEPPQLANLCFIAPIGERATLEGLKLARELRARGLRVELDGRGNSVKSMLRRADALSARLCLLLGDTELEKGVVNLKDLVERAQRDVPRSEVAETVATLLKRPVVSMSEGTP